jgi:hypothetical protein
MAFRQCWGHFLRYWAFSNQKIDQRSILLNGVRIPPTSTAKHLGMTLDAKLRWKAHIKKKQGELQIKFQKMYWPLRHRSEQSLYNKLLLYKQMLGPVWTYGVQLLGCAKRSNFDIQRYQNKALRCLVNAPWYARNSDIHRGLGVKTVAYIITRHALSHENRLQRHVNEEASSLLSVQHLIRRLKRHLRDPMGKLSSTSC